MNAVFNERQQFRRWWILIILLFPLGLIIYGIVQQVFMHVPFGDNPAPDFALYLILGFMVLIDVLFFIARLETKVDELGIHFRWFPFMQRCKLLRWEDIRQAEIITYRFVGYGLRLTIRYGTVYNVSGNEGVQIELQNGKRLLIGTRKADELRMAIAAFRPA